MVSVVRDTIRSLRELNICSRCIILFVEGSHGLDRVLRHSQDRVDRYCDLLDKGSSKKVSNSNELVSPHEQSAEESNQTLNDGVMDETISTKPQICLCCCGSLIMQQIDQLSDRVLNVIQQKQSSISGSDTSILDKTFPATHIALEVIQSPLFDLLKVFYRILSCKHTQKSGSYPNYSDIVRMALCERLKLKSRGKIQVTDLNDDTKYQITVRGYLNDQVPFCKTVFGDDFIPKKRKREHDEINDFEAIDDQDITKIDVEKLIGRAKRFTDRDIDELYRIFSGSDYSNAMECIWSEPTCHRCPAYILGRYRKLSRDVPQSPWMIGEERKGRSSIEEIVSEAIGKYLQTTIPCKLHGCGREDIDVRCLGNGRPFVVEVLRYSQDITDEALLNIANYINHRLGLNQEGDIEILWMKHTTKSTWENMQNIAEEKKKAYCCMIWTEKPVSREELDELESLASPISGHGQDEEGRHCLQIAQKTPLRVLHRRSLLTRPRFIYDIDTVLINPHYFIMKLTTSSGAYVKEFVHGDLGRTEPSVGSILKSKADILQLDVIGLFDEFEGGWKHAIMNQMDQDKADVDGSSTYSHQTATRNDEGEEESTLSWNDLKCRSLASFKETAPR